MCPVVQQQLLLNICHNNRNLALFLMAIKGVEKFTIVRNAASGNGGFQDITYPVKNVFVYAKERKRQGQPQHKHN